ncbi:MAG: amidohydrolase family protein [bacterium]
MTTILLQNARIIDGTGAPGFHGHVLLSGHRIAAVIRGAGEAISADEVLDCAGLCVTPGFIDMHSHADWQLPSDSHGDLLLHLLEQGVTTVVGGNCGVSPAPIRRSTIPLLERLASIAMDGPLGYEWSSVGGYLEKLEQTSPALNVAELVGHASIRYIEAGADHGRMRPDQLRRCEDHLRQAFDEGACGVSFGLGYSPGMYSPPDELEAFCLVAAAAGKPATVHLKALSWLSPCYPPTYLRSHNVRALRETLRVARDTGVRLQISHFIFAGRNTWRTGQHCLELVEEARRQGMDVMIDAFPYTCGNTTINAFLSYWFLAKLPGAYRSRLDRLRLAAEFGIAFPLIGFGYSDFQVMDIAVDGWEWCNGLTLADIAERWRVSPFEALLRISETSAGATLMLLHTYSGEPGRESVLESVLSHPLCLFETDTVILRRGYPNPASLGAFPRVLGEYCRERRLFGLEDAVRRMTSASADRFGLRDRGRLEPGKAADVVVFDAEQVGDCPPVGSRPAERPRGIHHVFLNGTQVVRAGRYEGGPRVGEVLRV